MSENRIEEGPPIWVESLLKPDEYKILSKRFSTYNPPMYKIKGHQSKWRNCDLTKEEQKEVNQFIDYLKNTVANDKCKSISGNLR
jgi:hypothetical protein